MAHVDDEACKTYDNKEEYCYDNENIAPFVTRQTGQRLPLGQRITPCFYRYLHSRITAVAVIVIPSPRLDSPANISSKDPRGVMYAML